jgi:hypothetical protein
MVLAYGCPRRSRWEIGVIMYASISWFIFIIGVVLLFDGEAASAGNNIIPEQTYNEWMAGIVLTFAGGFFGTHAVGWYMCRKFHATPLINTSDDDASDDDASDDDADGDDADGDDARGV